MKIARAVLLVAASALLVAPAFAAKKKKAPKAPPCVKGKVLTSFQMRMMQTELVVGALSCKLTPRYNEFVTAYRPDLMGAHKVLMRQFGRESRLEDYKSKTANEASQRSLANITEFCLYTSALYDKLLGLEKVQLAAFVGTEPAASRHGQNACDAPALVTASTTGKIVPMPRQKPGEEAAVMPAVLPGAAPVVIPAAAAEASTAPATSQQ
jgi:hypothetical protein